ncbi:twin-arginine translocase TatA/TatE family subunit [Gluconacetobacter azotocaptans]|uniref:Sec-independent protein translocase protein TatA n=1 Tax=Gluconacetobacter azotocaptans TaxID=142834 RepID=A0A7W4JV50_9PROT|nr:twin-arginine translocase TatA/TatE family subunit [Gluconacetobacter azotocaptans]MBB2191501.1 twin-arginine translocase TatA/TatE family subunit [Gluconacetobacter azotocaptans]MBM9403031.1 twin-arginine translocase TatA/TatE family subunit [Gluconacetobacter azotocaptans]GBQ32805.1 Sec-independent protein translocase protein TatA [Gluconacetobacter azotocaptans DSM 13594]
MGSLSIWHWLIVLAVVLVLFGGGGKISTLMGDVARGVKSFKKNMADDESMEAGTSGQPGGHIAPPGPTIDAQKDASFSGAGRPSGSPRS